jgi:hypothetical protein
MEITPQQADIKSKKAAKTVLFIFGCLNVLAWVLFIFFSSSLDKRDPYDWGQGLILLYLLGAFVALLLIQLVILFVKPLKNNLLYGAVLIVGNIAVLYFILYNHFQQFQ